MNYHTDIVNFWGRGALIGDAALTSKILLFGCFVVLYLSVFLRCRIFDELVGKIAIRKPRELYAVINLILMGLQYILITFLVM